MKHCWDSHVFALERLQLTNLKLFKADNELTLKFRNMILYMTGTYIPLQTLFEFEGFTKYVATNTKTMQLN
jgi:hypothetical protein